eukprot:SAG11_NODE_12385_length_706_cov_0.835255_1_plen_150_part_10
MVQSFGAQSLGGQSQGDTKLGQAPTGPVAHASARAQPRWMDDKHADACMICRGKFGLMLRRHDCRFCGWVVCSECSPNTLALDAWICGAQCKGHRIAQHESSLRGPPQRVCSYCFLLAPDEMDARQRQLVAKIDAGVQLAVSQNTHGVAR